MLQTEDGLLAQCLPACSCGLELQHYRNLLIAAIRTMERQMFKIILKKRRRKEEREGRGRRRKKKRKKKLLN